MSELIELTDCFKSNTKKTDIMSKNMSEQIKIINYLKSNTKKTDIMPIKKKFSNKRTHIINRMYLKITLGMDISEDVKKMYRQYKSNPLSNYGKFIAEILRIIKDEQMNDTYMEDVDVDVDKVVDKVVDKDVVVDIKRKKQTSKPNRIIISNNNCRNLTIINHPSS